MGRLRFAVRGLLLAGLLGLVSCGGGSFTTGGGTGGGGNGTGGGTDTGVPRGASGTAYFHVDVATGKVNVTPLSGNPTSRAVFTGSAVSFNSSTLLDQPGSAGIRVLNVAIRNNWALPIGQQPDGTVTGLRVLFGPITNLANANLDLRSSTDVSTVAGTGTAASTDGSVASAAFKDPAGIAVAADGSVYVSETGGNRVRKLAGGNVSTLVGGGTGTLGSGGAVGLVSPSGVACLPASAGVVLAESGRNRVVRVGADGRVTLIAGNGSSTSSDGPGNTAGVNSPTPVAIGPDGSIFVAEYNTPRIRRIRLTGSDPTQASDYTVTTVAGSGAVGAVDGVGTGASFTGITGLTIDSAGVLYAVDQGANRIRRVSATGEVVTIAGTDITGSDLDGPGTIARFRRPVGIVWTAQGLVICELYHTVRLLTLKDGAAPSSPSSWVARTLAGNGTLGAADGSGSSATFSKPWAVAVDGAGNVLLADRDNNKVRRLKLPAGLMLSGEPSGTTSSEPVQLSNASGLLPGASGTTVPYVDYQWYTQPQPPAAGRSVLAAGATCPAQPWWFVVPEGVKAFGFTVTVEAATSGLVPVEGAPGAGSPNVAVTTVAGSTDGHFGSQDGPATAARFKRAFARVDGAGNIYIADAGPSKVQRLDAAGTVSSVAGGGADGTDGPGTQAGFNWPSFPGVSADGSTLFIPDQMAHTIRRVQLTRGADPGQSSSWTVSTIAGANGEVGYVDGDGSVARLNEPVAAVVASPTMVYVAECNGNRIRRLRLQGSDASLATSWVVDTLAGDVSGAAGASGTTDGTGSAARLSNPQGIAIDRQGNLFVTDNGNHRIRRVTPDGVVSTFAGPTGSTIDTGATDGPAATARFGNPYDVAVDAAGYVYVADYGNNRIRRISPTGVVSTVAGTGVAGLVDGSGAIAQFDHPRSVAVGPSGELIVCDGGEGERIRKIQRVISAGTQ